MRTKIITNIFIYFLIIFGGLYLYFIDDIEILLNPKKEPAPKSKVEFLYQQF